MGLQAIVGAGGISVATKMAELLCGVPCSGTSGAGSCAAHFVVAAAHIRGDREASICSRFRLLSATAATALPATTALLGVAVPGVVLAAGEAPIPL